MQRVATYATVPNGRCVAVGCYVRTYAWHSAPQRHSISKARLGIHTLHLVLLASSERRKSRRRESQESESPQGSVKCGRVRGSGRHRSSSSCPPHLRVRSKQSPLHSALHSTPRPGLGLIGCECVPRLSKSPVSFLLAHYPCFVPRPPPCTLLAQHTKASFLNNAPRADPPEFVRNW